MDDDLVLLRSFRLDDAADDGAREQARAILRSAVSRRRRRRMLVAVVAAVVALAVPLIAIGSTQGWWLLDRWGIVPVGEVVVVQSGDLDGVPWTLNAFRTDRLPHSPVIAGEQLVCYGVSRGQTSQQGGGFLDCGLPPDPLRPQIKRDRPMPEMRWIAAGQARAHEESPRWIVGIAAPEVKSVEIILGNGDVIETATVPAPEALGVRLNFFVYIALPPCAGPVREFIPLDEAGQPLEPSQRPAPAITPNPTC